MMEIPFRQTTKSGCGLYCLANLFADRSLLNDVGNLQHGLDVGQLNKRISDSADWGHICYIETVLATNTQLKNFPTRITDDSVFDSDPYEVVDADRQELAIPYLLNVKGENRFHLILGVLNLKDRQLYLFDSLRDEREVISPKDFIEHYHVVTVNLFRMWDHVEDDMVMNIKKAMFNHLFNPGE